MKAKGHAVEVGRRKWGNMQAVFLDKKTGASRSPTIPAGRAACCSDNADNADTEQERK